MTIKYYRLRQGNILACLLSNTALAKIIWESRLEIRGTIFYKSAQVLARLHWRLDITRRSNRITEEFFVAIPEISKRMRRIIQPNNKYMAVKSLKIEF